MKTYSISVAKRTVIGKEVQSVREEGFVPGVVYGPDVKENILVQLPVSAAEKLYTQAGESSVVMVTVEGNDTPMETLIKDVQMDPVQMKLTHIDFYKIKAGDTIEVETPLNFINEAPAVKTFGGTLVTSIDTLKVRCLPKDLVESLEVDLSVLTTFDDTIYVKDIKVPATLTVMIDGNTPVASVTPVEEEEAVVAPVAVEMPELVSKKKGEEGESAEGAAPAAKGGAAPAAKAPAKK